MKRCGTCKEIKDESNFGKSKAKKDGLQSSCRNCRSAYHKVWYENNRQLQMSRVAAHKISIRQYLYNYLRTHACVDCGNTSIATLQFDHVRGEKLFNIGNSRDVGSLPKIIEEIAKCEIRCANCHAEKTAKQFGWYQALMRG